MSDMYWIDNAAEPTMGIQIGGSVMVNVHDAARCAGEFCVMHNPSDHHMRDWPTNWRGDRGLVERLCPHGIGHPDPDDLEFHLRNGREWQGVHGCDGCCWPRPTIPEEAAR